MNTRVIIFNDNQAVIGMVNRLTSKCPQCMKLLRLIALDGIYYNRRLIVQFVPSRDNILTDSLSRLDFRHFFAHAPSTVEKFPTLLPQAIWPASKL